MNNQSAQRGCAPRVVVLSSVHDALDPRIFHKQARTLAAAGFDVTLIARHTRDETRDGVRISALPAPRSRLGRPALWARLAWRTRRLRPSVIHIHDPELLPLLLLLKAVTGAATVYDAHEYYGEEVARRAWIPAPLRRPAARLTHMVESFAARRLDAVVAVNEHMAAGFRRRGARAITAHNYPRRDSFDLERPVQPPSARVAGYVGLLSPDRGLATVWAVAQQGVPLCIIGRVDWAGAPPEAPRDAETWAAAGAELMGVIPADEVPRALDGIAVGWIPFLDTGNNRRTIPLKLLEYMAAGRPVVASDLGYIAQIVRAGGCGLLAPPGDAGAHAAALRRLLDDPDLARQMGEAGRAAVRTRYIWEHEGAKLVALYRRLIAREKRRKRGRVR